MPAEASPQPSETQLDVLRYLIDHIQKHGYQPTQAEMAEHFGVTKNAIQARLKELAKRNIIDMPEGARARERAIGLKHVRFKAFFEEPS